MKLLKYVRRFLFGLIIQLFAILLKVTISLSLNYFFDDIKIYSCSILSILMKKTITLFKEIIRNKCNN